MGDVNGGIYEYKKKLIHTNEGYESLTVIGGRHRFWGACGTLNIAAKHSMH